MLFGQRESSVQWRWRQARGEGQSDRCHQLLRLSWCKRISVLSLQPGQISCPNTSECFQDTWLLNRGLAGLAVVQIWVTQCHMFSLALRLLSRLCRTVKAAGPIRFSWAKQPLCYFLKCSSVNLGVAFWTVYYYRTAGNPFRERSGRVNIYHYKVYCNSVSFLWNKSFGITDDQIYSHPKRNQNISGFLPVSAWVWNIWHFALIFYSNKSTFSAKISFAIQRVPLGWQLV